MASENQSAQRTSNKRTALVLLLIALVFFAGIIINRMVFVQ
jgi:hypothetical protein